MRVVNHPEAEQELEEAALYYQDCAEGLGEDFLDEFENTIRRIVESPERWATIQENVRKVNFHRFPYAVIYQIRQGDIFIIAVNHLHRRPFYWKRRI